MVVLVLSKTFCFKHSFLIISFPSPSNANMVFFLEFSYVLKYEENERKMYQYIGSQYVLYKIKKNECKMMKRKWYAKINGFLKGVLCTQQMTIH